MMLITKKFTFDSAHKLLNYEGKCKHLHGHTYTLNVTVKGEVEKNSGMIIDFGDIKKIVKKNALDTLDHNYLNDIIEQPTAENIAVWIWNHLNKDLNLFKIELWETPDSFVTYYGEENKDKN